MSSKSEPDRQSWVQRFVGGGMTRQQPPAAQPTGASPGPALRPPSRAHRMSHTTWQDKAAIKELKRLAIELGTTQQQLIAEGINHVLQKHGRPGVAT